MFWVCYYLLFNGIGISITSPHYNLQSLFAVISGKKTASSGSGFGRRFLQRFQT